MKKNSKLIINENKRKNDEILDKLAKREDSKRRRQYNSRVILMGSRRYEA